MKHRSIWYLTHSTGFDYQNGLYQPLKHSDLWDKCQIILPHENPGETQNSKIWIEKADLILAEVTYPSTGQGIELGWANSIGKSLICFHRTGTKPSRSLRFVCEKIFEYRDARELIEKLSKF